MELQIRPGDRQIDVLRRVLRELNLPPSLLQGVPDEVFRTGTANGGTPTTYTLSNPASNQRIEVRFNQSRSGVVHNVAVRAAEQTNTAVGANAWVVDNEAEDPGTRQQNTHFSCSIF